MFDPAEMVRLALPLVILIVLLANALKVVPEYERGVLFRLGRFRGVRGPGLIIIIPVIDRLVRVSLRIIAWTFRPRM